MTVGTAVSLFNSILDHFRGGATWTPPAGRYAKLHTGDPGVGTANASQHTTRQSMPFGAASGGAIAQTGTAPIWTIASLTSPTSETLTHYSVWDAVTGGTCLYTVLCAASKTVSNGDQIQLSAYGYALGPIAS